MQCQEAQDHHQDLLDGELDSTIVTQVWTHMKGCSPCAQAFRLQQEIRGLVKEQAPRHTPPPELLARVQSLLSGQVKHRPRRA